MHHIYHTEGIILESRNYGEAGKCYYVFTRSLGLIFCSATGVRKIESKLRFVLQDYSYIKLDLVKGKDFWRVTSCGKTNELEEIKNKKENLKVLVQIARLLKRLLAGEDPNEILFLDVLKGVKILEKIDDRSELLNIEVILVLRILNNLGYVGEHNTTIDLVSSPFEPEILLEVAQNKNSILRQINKALRETQL
ncbi:MAG: DNA repair protein RecO [bacterium]|nr:DNA repair protein RecO [bacterium]